jgi:hypothetical protein
VKELTPYLGDVGLHWDDLPRFLNLRRELFETDMRFAQLSRRSVFAALDKAGVLSHRVCPRRTVKAAITCPPAGGRAELRGELVRRNADRKNRYRGDWQAVWDCRGKRVLDLSDPFETQERWRKLSKEEAACFNELEPWDLRPFRDPFQRRATGSRPTNETGTDIANDVPF